jgi:hypothetical protein
VDGRAPDPPPGVFGLPATALGDGDDPVGEDGVRDGTLDADVGAVGGVVVPGCDAEADAPGDDAGGVVVATGVALSARTAEGVALLGEGLELAWLGPGRSAIEPVDAANTAAAASAARPSSATSGTTAIRRPRGRNSRQIGQKPETGVYG